MDCNSRSFDDLVKTINDNAPETHPEYTPSVCCLMERGLEVIPLVLPLMRSDDELTRSRAQVVLQGVLARRHGFQLGRGWTTPDGETRWKDQLNELGNLDADADRDARESAIKLWLLWYQSQHKPA